MHLKKSNLFAYLCLFLFAFLPLAGGIGFAFCYSFGIIGALNQGFTFAHWKIFFTDHDAWFSFVYSSIIALTAIVISVSVSLLIVLRYQRFFSRGIFSYIIYIPLAFPGIVAAFFFFQLLGKSGILARVSYQLHIIQSIDQFPDLVNDRYGIGLITTLVFLSFPFFTLLFVNLYKTERVQEFQQLATGLGATKRQYLLKVTIPLLLKRSLPNCILYFIFTLGAFEVPLLLGRSRPEMVSVLAVRKLQRFDLLEVPQGYVVAVLYTLLAFIIIYFSLKKRMLRSEL